MYTLLVTLIVIAAIFMILIVLIQESKGGGLASGFASANSVAGVRQTTNFIEKATWGLAAAMVVISIACAYCVPQAQTEESVIEKAATEQPQTNPNNVQGFGATQQNAGAQQAAPAQQSAPAQQAAPAQQSAPAAKK